MPRKTPRPPAEARAIARALRRRYISAEAEASAKAAMTRLEATQAGPRQKAGAGSLDPLRRREDIDTVDNSPFTEEERERAKAILQKLQMAYPRHSR